MVDGARRKSLDFGDFVRRVGSMGYFSRYARLLLEV